MKKIEQLVECLVHIHGRRAIPLDHVQKIVGTTPRQIKAFNLCDGTRSQRDIAEESKIKPSNLSRSFSRWIESGVAFWLGEGREARLLHIYPIPSSASAIRRNRRGK